MDLEFKRKWVEALRSGQYKQGKLRLYDSSTDSYCCLGVACHIQDIPKEDLNDLSLPINVVKIFHPLIDDLLSLSDNNRCMLTQWNDGCISREYNPNGERMNFNDIANFIEENL